MEVKLLRMMSAQVAVVMSRETGAIFTLKTENTLRAEDLAWARMATPVNPWNCSVEGMDGYANSLFSCRAIHPVRPECPPRARVLFKKKHTERAQ